MLGEDVEDQRNAVDDVAAELLLQVALLCRRQLVVEDHDIGVECVGERAQLVDLSRSDVSGGIGARPALQHGLHRIRARGVGEQGQLGERRLGFFN